MSDEIMNEIKAWNVDEKGCHEESCDTEAKYFSIINKNGVSFVVLFCEEHADIFCGYDDKTKRGENDY